MGRGRLQTHSGNLWLDSESHFDLLAPDFKPVKGVTIPDPHSLILRFGAARQILLQRISPVLNSLQCLGFEFSAGLNISSKRVYQGEHGPRSPALTGSVGLELGRVS